MLNSPLLAALSFYLIPIIIGYGLISIKDLILRKKLDFNWTDVLIRVLFESFVYGGLYIFALMLLMNYLFPNNYIEYFKASILITTLLMFVLTLIRNIIEIKEIGFKSVIKTQAVLCILLSITLSLIVYAIWKVNSPVTATLNWDIFHHQLLADLIQKGTFSISTRNMSDTFQFGGYTTLFHVLLATPQTIFKVDTLSFWWYLEYFHLLSTIIVSYLMGYVVTKNKWVAIVSAILGAFVFESSSAYTSLFLIPQNLTATLSAAFIARTIRKLESKDSIDVTLVAFIVFAVLDHLIIGPIGSLFLIYVVLHGALVNKFKSNKTEHFITISALISFVIIAWLTTKIDLNFINRNEASFYNFSFGQKISLFKDFYGYLLFAFLPLGLVQTAMNKGKNYKMILIMALGFITLVMSPIPYSIKFYSVGRFVVHAYVAIGMWMLLKRLNNFWRVISIVILTITLATVFIINTIIYKQVPSYKEIATHTNPNEITAAKYIKEHYADTNTMLISDPASMHIIETLSGVNTPGGAYTSTETRKTLSDMYFSRDASKIRDQLFKIQDGLNTNKPDKLLFVISGRFKRWQLQGDEDKLGIQWNVWKPYDITTKDLEKDEFIDFMESKCGFKEVYKNEGLVVLEIE